VGEALHTRRPSQVHDAAALCHGCELAAHAAEDAAQVDVQHKLPVGITLVRQRRTRLVTRSQHARTVDGAVQSSERVHDGANPRVDIFGTTNVSP
jgi:hypothetical protein